MPTLDSPSTTGKQIRLRDGRSLGYAEYGDPAMLIENWAEATHAGIRGFAWEALIFTRPWGFRLEDITMEVHLWHGEEDASTPLPMTRYVANAIPNCHATFLPGEGHFLFFNHWEEILAVLVS